MSKKSQVNSFPDDHPYIKFPCIDCKHCKLDWVDKLFTLFSEANEVLYRCHRPSKKTVSPIFGAQETSLIDYPHCTSERTFNLEERCGTAGKYWQPKHKRDLFKMFDKVKTNE